VAIPTIGDILDEVLRGEDGFVEDPADPGGATNFGISLRYARSIGLDFNGDCDTHRDDTLLVTADKASGLQRDDFWSGPGISRLPGEIQPVMVDWAVNSDPPRPIMAMQRVINRVRIGFTLDDDGVIGPKTRRASEHAQADSISGEDRDRQFRIVLSHGALVVDSNIADATTARSRAVNCPLRLSGGTHDRYVRLHHCRCRFRRLDPREPAVGG
jgi:lysozyme family protein